MWALTLLGSGCVHPAGGRVAEEWSLVGPFKALSRTRPAEAPAPPSPSDALPAAPDPAAPAASTNGLFGLRSQDKTRDMIAETPQGEEAPESPALHHHLFGPPEEQDDSFWYLDLGFRSGFTKLGTTKQQLDRRVDLPLMLDAFGVFAHPTTPADRKTDMALTTGYIGVGRRETEWLTWNFYLGTGVGADRDRQRWLNANLDVNFKYALYYTGLTVDIYFWGLSQRGRFKSLAEHFKASRPYALTGMEFGYLKARGWGHFALAPVTLYADEQVNEDWLISYLLGLGWEFPLSDRWAFNVQGHYTFHIYRPEEYNGWNLTTALRYRF